MGLREEWENKAASWMELATNDPYYDLLNLPAFLPLVPTPGRLTLEVGCGEGRVARALAGLGHRVVAVDGSPSLARAAASRGTPVALADAAALPVPDGAADVLVSFMVLMDVDHLEACVAELGRVLAPGGTLCMGIIHPIATAGLFVPGDPNRTFYVGEYLRRMSHVLDVERQGSSTTIRFHIEHRPLEAYSRALEAAGLVITAVREPAPSEEAVAQHDELADWRRVPNFLHLTAERRRP